LVFFERLFELFPRREVPDVAGDFLGGRAEPADGVGD